MSVLPLSTERLHLRVMRSTDAAALTAYRSDPEVARFQDWSMPFTMQDALALLADQDDADDIAEGRWIQIAIELATDSGPVTVGDLAVGMPSGPFIAYLGYTLAPEHQGRGYASEAAEAMVDALFEHTPIQRINATLDPENVASMRVIEPLGFRFEGIARRAELIRGEWLDDMRFALLRDDRAAWLERDRSTPSAVRLVEMEPGSGRSWTRLVTHRFQQQFVSTVAESFADAAAPDMRDGGRIVPWMRGIEADGVPVGFLMMAAVTETAPDPYLWRLVIDRHHQRRGVATMVLRELFDQLRADGCTKLLVSYVVAPGGPEPLYAGLGFVRTGEVDGNEVVAALAL